MAGSVQSAARITQPDIDDLDQASNDLALAYQLIAEAKPRCAAHVLPLIYRANATVVRMTDKGTAAFVRHFQTHPAKRPRKISPVILAALSAAVLRPENPDSSSEG